MIPPCCVSWRRGARARRRQGGRCLRLGRVHNDAARRLTERPGGEDGRELRRLVHCRVDRRRLQDLPRAHTREAPRAPHASAHARARPPSLAKKLRAKSCVQGGPHLHDADEPLRLEDEREEVGVGVVHAQRRDVRLNACLELVEARVALHHRRQVGRRECDDAVDGDRGRALRAELVRDRYTCERDAACPISAG